MRSKYKHGFLNLFPNCYITIGNKRALIQNNTTKTIDLIPLSLASVLNSALEYSIAEIYREYEKQDHAALDQYFDFLIAKGYAFTTSVNAFRIDIEQPATVWDMPFTFTNCIIDYNDLLNPVLKKVILELSHLGCHTLQVRFLNRETKEIITAFLDSVYATKKLSGVSVVADFTTSGLELNEYMDNFVSEYPVISEIIQYNAGCEEFFENEKLRFRMLKITSGIDQYSCGVIHPFYFSANIQHYTESLAHNTCLNRKVAIDAVGNIKNCPSMKTVFGNIRDTSLEEAMTNPGFKKYWNIAKDQVAKCKDCEFRHVCTDCRAYLDNPDDIYSAPLKCGYDPYTCKWEEWSTNPLKQAAIEYYQQDI